MARGRNEIENTVKSCTAYQVVMQSPAVTTGSCQFCESFSRSNVSRLHVDAHSKWPEVLIIKEMSSQFGLPEQLVTENGPQFESDDFTQFTKQNGVKQIR